MRRIGLTGLMKIEFPGHTVRLCDGGFIVFDGETYRSADSVFGTLGEVGELDEGVGEEVPHFELTLLPPGETAIGELVQPGYQTARASFWLAEYDPVTGLVVGTPELQFFGQVDQITIEFLRDGLRMQTTIVGLLARMLERNIGNSLNPVFHKSVWAGETGHDNATGLGRNIAWGVEAPKPGIAMSTGGVSASSGDYGQFGPNGLSPFTWSAGVFQDV